MTRFDHAIDVDSTVPAGMQHDCHTAVMGQPVSGASDPALAAVDHELCRPADGASPFVLQFGSRVRSVRSGGEEMGPE